jgi:creatinine amidohydrolase
VSIYAKEMTKDEFAAALKENPIVVLPVGSMEEHGDHLPLGSDTFEIDFVVQRLSKKLKMLVLPTVNYGNCGSTYNFPGTISISFETLRALIYDILAESVRHGAKKLLVISGHAGTNHMLALRIAAEHVVKKHPEVKIMVLSDYDLVPEYRGGNIPKWDGHAGKAETSRMLNIRPDISKRGTRASRPKRKEYLVLPDPESMFPSGIIGDPTKATAELGKKIDDFLLRRLVRLLRENLEAEEVTK